MQRPLIRPCAYSILILLFTIITTAVFISPLLLFHYSYCHKTVTTDKLLRVSLFPGAAELTTPLLRLTSILCLPLCRINKLGNTSLEDCCDPLYLWVIRERVWKICEPLALAPYLYARQHGNGRGRPLPFRCLKSHDASGRARAVSSNEARGNFRPRGAHRGTF